MSWCSLYFHCWPNVSPASPLSIHVSYPLKLVFLLRFLNLFGVFSSNLSIISRQTGAAKQIWMAWYDLLIDCLLLTIQREIVPPGKISPCNNNHYSGFFNNKMTPSPGFAVMCLCQRL